MHGNVWEWCQDWFGPYAGETALDPQGPATGSGGGVVVRGGYWYLWSTGASLCRSASRHGPLPVVTEYPYFGFRVVLAPGQP